MSRNDCDLVTAECVAERFGVTVGTVNSWVRDGRVPYIRVSRRTVRFRLNEVEQALTHQVNPSRVGSEVPR